MILHWNIECLDSSDCKVYTTKLLFISDSRYAHSELAQTQACTTSDCNINGDIRLLEDGTPQIIYGGSTVKRWRTVCSHRFWENDVGANMFCKKLVPNNPKIVGRIRAKPFDPPVALLNERKSQSSGRIRLHQL